MRITSTHNPLVQRIRALSRAPVRRERREYLAEGVRLVAEAVASGQSAPLALYDPDALRRSAAGTELLERVPDWAGSAFEVDPRVLVAAAQTETPAGIVAVLRLPEPPPLSAHKHCRHGLVLDGLSDPGNAGTILRTADAFGVGYAITTAGSVDLFSPKVVRAGMGAHFRLPLYEHVSWRDICEALPAVDFVVADAGGGEPVQHIVWPEQVAIVIGGETAGVSTEAMAAAQIKVHIPIRPEVESLNVAVAAAILLYAGPGSALRGEKSRYR